jgi:PIN domain nuclease of toxin-antitoxin system
VRLLLDTHTWLWLLTAPERLSESARETILDPANETVLSVASVWETAIKHAAGKLVLASSPLVLVETSIRDLATSLLPIDVRHALEASSLPLYHRDPFDRMLVAQARLDGCTLVTADEVVHRYGVACIWAT